jgi:hypothetical protein
MFSSSLKRQRFLAFGFLCVAEEVVVGIVQIVVHRK